MLCSQESEIVLAWLSFLGSVILIWPAWKASVILKVAYSLYKKSGEAGSSFSKGLHATAQSLEKEAGKWTLLDHRVLLLGIIFLVLSGLGGLVSSYCQVPP